MMYASGLLIDWSGNSGLAVCQHAECTTVIGPFPSMRETRSAARDHWAAAHPGAQPPKKENVAFVPDSCLWGEEACTEIAGRSGYCRRHSVAISNRKSRCKQTVAKRNAR
jgi:hypothetical protein